MKSWSLRHSAGIIRDITAFMPAVARRFSSQKNHRCPTTNRSQRLPARWHRRMRFSSVARRDFRRQAAEIFTTQIPPRFARISASSLRNIISLARSTACAHRFRVARNFGDILRRFCTPRRQRRCARLTRISTRSWREKIFTFSRQTRTRSLSSSIRKAKSVRSRATTDFSSAAAAAPMKPGMRLCQFAK